MTIIQSAYPTTLPAPQAAPLTPTERRALSDLPGKRNARALSVDRLATQQLTWTFLNGDQVNTWLNWGRVELIDWSCWFVASWSQPQGGVAVRRFIGAPSYPRYFANVGWLVNATVQVRGRGELPNVDVNLPPAPPPPPEVHVDSITLKSTSGAMAHWAAYLADFSDLVELGGTFDETTAGSNVTLDGPKLLATFAGTGSVLSTGSAGLSGHVGYELVITDSTGSCLLGYFGSGGLSYDKEVAHGAAWDNGPDTFTETGPAWTDESGASFGAGGTDALDDPLAIGDVIGFVVQASTGDLFLYKNGIALTSVSCGFGFSGNAMASHA